MKQPGERVEMDGDRFKVWRCPLPGIPPAGLLWVERLPAEPPVSRCKAAPRNR